MITIQIPDWLKNVIVRDVIVIRGVFPRSRYIFQNQFGQGLEDVIVIVIFRQLIPENKKVACNHFDDEGIPQKWELQIPRFENLFGVGNTLGLVPSSLPHTLGYACTLYAPHFLFPKWGKIQGSVNGGFQTVVRVFWGNEIPLPPFYLNLTSCLPQFYLFFNLFLTSI